MFALFLLWSQFSFADFAIEEQDFRLISSRGLATSLGYFTDFEHVLVMAWPANCRGQKDFLKSFASWEKKIARHPGKLRVLLLDPDTSQNRDSANRLQDKFGFKSPVLMDSSQSISRGFELKRTGDYLLISTKPWALVQRGNWTDGELQKKFSKDLKDETLKISAKKIKTCPLKYRDVSHLRWDERFARTFYKNCAACHSGQKLGDLFPNDDAVFNWWSMNRMVMRMQTMPPINYDPQIGNCTGSLGFRMQQQDLDDIHGWLSGARPEKPPGTNYMAKFRAESDEMTAKFYPPLGEPDYDWSLKVPDKVPATGPFYYKMIQVAGPLEEDVEIGAYTYDGSYSAVHHIQVFLFPHALSETKGIDPMRGIRPDDTLESARPNYMFGILPGHQSVRFGQAGWVFPKGFYVVLQFHYEPTGREELNQSHFKVYKNRRKEPLSPLHRETFLEKPFTIPAGEKKFVVDSFWKAPDDVSLLTVTHHAHVRAKYFSLSMTPPGEKKEIDICRVSNMTHGHHQDSDDFIDPIPVKKGTLFKATYIYDNSKENLENPEPLHDVKVGFGTDDEMAFTNIRYVTGPFKRMIRCWDEPLGCPVPRGKFVK